MDQYGQSVFLQGAGGCDRAVHFKVQFHQSEVLQVVQAQSSAVVSCCADVTFVTFEILCFAFESVLGAQLPDYRAISHVLFFFCEHGFHFFCIEGRFAWKLLWVPGVDLSGVVALLSVVP